MKPFSALALACLPLLAIESHAHALWTEPAEGGYRIFFGEPGEGIRENKDEFSKVGPVKALDASGKEAKGTQGEDHIFVKATPAGISVSALEVPLHGEGEDALRVFFYARSGEAGKKIAPAKDAALEILPEGKDSVSFILLKGGKPFTDGRLEMFAPGGWNRVFKADAQGKVKLETPWAGLYVLEASYTDETPGKIGDKPFKGSYHAATLSFVKK